MGRTKLTFKAFVTLIDIRYDALVSLTTKMRMETHFRTDAPPRIIPHEDFNEFMSNHPYTTHDENLKYARDIVRFKYCYTRVYTYTDNSKHGVPAVLVEVRPSEVKASKFLDHVAITNAREEALLYHLLCAISTRWGNKTIDDLLSFIRNLNRRRVIKYNKLLSDIELIRSVRSKILIRKIARNDRYGCTIFPSFCMHEEDHDYEQKNVLVSIASEWILLTSN